MMSLRRPDLLLIVLTHVAVLLGVGLQAEAGVFGFGGDTWKEEVLLHDGSKLVITRAQSYGGQHEIGQPPPIKEHTVTFTLPQTTKTITWTSKYGEDLGRTDFHLLAVHVLNGTPYLVAEPNLCLSYNKWGRPNPPYVFFKHNGVVWQRIPLESVPDDFSTLNVAISLDTGHVREMIRLGLVSAEEIRQRNSRLSPPEYRTILREPMKPESAERLVSCEELVLYKGRWILPNDPVAKEFIDRHKK
jgi:hypothetical protein